MHTGGPPGVFLRQFLTVTHTRWPCSRSRTSRNPCAIIAWRVLLDECLPLDFRFSFPEHEAHTAERAGFKGLKNGDLLLAPKVPDTTSLTALPLRGRGQAGRKPAPRRPPATLLVVRSKTNQILSLPCGDGCSFLCTNYDVTY